MPVDAYICTHGIFEAPQLPTRRRNKDGTQDARYRMRMEFTEFGYFIEGLDRLGEDDRVCRRSSQFCYEPEHD
jgi:hypothetical protein